MSDIMNPYETPRIEISEPESGESFGVITESMLTSIKQSSSWIRFLAILGFVYAGLTIVPMVLFVSILPFVDSLADGAFAEGLGLPTGLFTSIVLFAILIFGIVIIIPLLFLHNIGSKMRTYVQTNNESALELAFKNNKSFWKFCGIFIIISLALIPVSLIIVGVLYV